MSIWDLAADQLEGSRPRWDTPGALAQDLTRYEPTPTVQTPALELIDEELVRLFNTPDGRLIVTMPPQEGKSTRVAKDFVIWALTQNPELRIVGASYGQSLANRNGRAIRNAIAAHPELGIAIALDNGAVHEWQLAGHEGGVLSVGVGAGVTGRPADLLIIDDPIKDRKEADSELYRDGVWDWWTDSASTRLAPGAPVVVILTRWHQDDLAGRLLRAEDGETWRVLNIPAQADHDPEKGEADALGRDVGEYMVSARGRTEEQWEAIKLRSGSRTWNALYQGRPSAATGTIFLADKWVFYEQPHWIIRSDGSYVVIGFDEVIQSWDMTFKNTEGTDFVVGQIWGRRGADAYLLDQTRARRDFPGTLRAFVELTAKWPQSTLKIVEDKANGPAVIAMLRRRVPGIVPEVPQGSKEARASAVSPLQEAKNVWLPHPDLAPWIGDFIAEASAFPTGVHDDQVDAMTQALNRLVLQPFISETLQPEEYDAIDARGYWASPV